MVQEEVAELHELPSRRPALLALAVVVAVSLAMIGGTLLMAQRASERTNELVENSLSSVKLVGDLRYAVARLANATPDARAGIEQQIARGMRAYEPLAVSAEEALERARLERALDRFLSVPAGSTDSAAWRALVQDSLRRLVDINAAAANATLAEVHREHRTVVVAQLGAGILTLAAAAVVAMLVNRVIQRQRRLIEHVMGTLRERNTELAAFAPRTAHDLRGPLAPILGYADLLAQGAPVDVAKAGRRIRSATERMAEIIENLLALSISGHPPPGATDIEPVVRRVLDELAGELAGADVQTTVDDARVACAPSVLRQLLHNIIGNASKYRAPDRRLALHIDVRGIDGDAELMITDNGVGMSAEAIARAFDPYYRFSSASDVPGLGLGLSIVQRTIHAVGGTCKLVSEVDHGTRFVMRLPRVERQALGTALGARDAAPTI